MWSCKHCKQQFSFLTTSEKANHTRWSQEVVPLIEQLVKEKWALSASGNTSPLHGEIKGSTPLGSTK